MSEQTMVLLLGPGKKKANKQADQTQTGGEKMETWRGEEGTVAIEGDRA